MHTKLLFSPSAKRFFYLTVVLFIGGLLFLYSASSVQSFRLFGDPNSMILRQLAGGGVLGALAFLVATKTDYTRWKKISFWLVVLSALLLVVVYLPGVGISAGGAKRWIDLGFITFQPGELAKFSAVVFSAASLAKIRAQKQGRLSDLYPLLFVCGVLCTLLLLQPDMGTAAALLLPVLVLMVYSGVSLKNLAILNTGFLVIALILILVAPYRLSRLIVFLDPSHDTLGAGYQLNQSLTAVGSGGAWGNGYGLSKQKHNYLPEPVGDSIVAVVAEEMGFFRVVFIVFVLMIWILFGFWIAGAAPDVFGRLLAAGLMSSMTIQMLINAGSALGLLPLTGIPFPFLSYGSSALIFTLLACGVLVNIAKKSKGSV